tara:strand:- start:1660 stop:1866 length:207 start_codon:yes stop_codon:yes gene_type:complete
MNLYLVDTGNDRQHFKASHVELREGKLLFFDSYGDLIKSFVLTKVFYFDDISNNQKSVNAKHTNHLKS